jgi:two-component system, cell cycle sensor histidine kinase and response regulator CckA
MAHEPTKRVVDFDLVRSPKNLLAFIEHSPGVAYLKDADGRMLYVNRMFEQTFQRPAAHFLGKTDAELWPPDVATRLHANDLKVLSTGERIETIEHVPTPDGCLRSWLSFKFRVVGGAGEYYLGGMSIDVTAREQAECAVRDSEARFREIFEHSPDAIFVEDFSGKVMDCNEAACRLHGMSRSELIGRSCFDLVPVQERDRVREAYPAQLTLDIGATVGGFSLHADGHATPVELRVNRITYDGQPALLLHVRDVTDRQRADEQLRESEAKYRQLVEQLPAITYMAEFGDGRWMFVSPQIESLLGFTATEWAGEKCPWLGQIHRDDRARVLAAEARCQATGEPFALEYRLHARDGRVVWFSDHSVVVRDGAGRPRYLHGVMFDISARKALEEQLAQAHKMDAIGRLAGGVAHDFNNILTTILGYSELILRRADADTRVRDNAQEIRKAADRAASLTRQLLAFSRKQTLQPQVLDLNTIVTEMDKMLRRLISETIHLDLRIDPGLWRATADPGQIQQVIMNLAVNARDAMPSGGALTIETANVTLDEHYVREHTDACAGEHVLLAISDTGVGISAEVKEHLFEPFFTTKEIGQGTGLGLATCYGIVKQSGGHINVYTELGRGTTFKVYLPRTVESATAPAAVLPAQVSPRGKERVLLVEDEQPVREMSTLVLRDLGYDVVEARDGDEALRLTKAANRDAFDLLFTDMVMPRMGGKELAYWFRLTNPGTRVLFTSGYPEKAMAHNGELVAGIAFLHKPYTPDALAQKVRVILDN